jgi:hypothetical protein
MKTAIPRLKLIFVCIFAVACVLIWALQIFYVWPRDRCEARGNWWDPQARVCATPVSLSTLTGRPNRPAKPPVASQPASRVAPGAQSTSPAP